MLKDPVKKTLGALVQGNHKYVIPNFQRSYAWDTEQLSKFWQDILYCAEQSILGNSVHHYMGEILLHKMGTDFNDEIFQIIDGQQRITTYLIFCSCIGKALRKMLPSLSRVQKSKANSLIARLRGKLFLNDSNDIRLETKIRDQLLLSTRIIETFNNLTITNIDGAVLISNAFNFFNKRLDELVLLPNSFNLILALENIMNEKCYTIRLEVEQLADIFSLFIVVNSTGLHLTAGELLRAKTIESFRNDQAKQRLAENYWNEILLDDTKRADSILTQIYVSKFGEACKKDLFQSYIDNYFTECNKRSLDAGEKTSLMAKIESLKNEFIVASNINKAVWPFESAYPQWKKDRLKTLINLLGHVGCIPLLIASKQLGENKFYAIVSKVELFFFNAKVICNIHAESFLEKYREEIVEIRRDPQAYNVSSLVNKLNNIRTRNNCDSEFVVKLPQLLVYNGAIKKNTIKYFLYMINLFYLSFRTPGQYIEPVSTINYCIAGLNIEHIYPRKAKGTQINSTLEPLKDSLGNLVIMCEAINSNRLRSKTFALKKPYYRNCGFKSAESLFALADWSATEVANRELDYVNLATKIFVDNNNI